MIYVLTEELKDRLVAAGGRVVQQVVKTIWLMDVSACHDYENLLGDDGEWTPAARFTLRYDAA